MCMGNKHKRQIHAYISLTLTFGLSYFYAFPNEKPVEYDVCNFNAILKLIWKFAQAIQLNESFIVYLVCWGFRFYSLFCSTYLPQWALFAALLIWWCSVEQGRNKNEEKKIKNKHEWMKRAFGFFYSPYMVRHEWNDSMSTAHVPSDKTNMDKIKIKHKA